ncbi:hypothetical protein CWATWH0402_802 [Crocosphaera watsonii WH 0402]|uniref:Uncharacterized protein n=1 Tax=Crocosphaera watsonii WH 0402 TaxID=1284629 RepID=T2JGI8_CROWT|nr:hypothetical protein CWATWH0402_802 [Crocosphaera watsonii WH 0402]
MVLRVISWFFCQLIQFLGNRVRLWGGQTEKFGNFWGDRDKNIVFGQIYYREQFSHSTLTPV